MAALAAETKGRIRFDGIGGPRMEAQGLRSRVPLADLAVMGLAEVLPHAFRILRHARETAAAARALEPAVVVTIDAPSFSHRVAKRLVGAGIPLVQYVAPSVWAWKPWRAARLARTADHLLALLPFEPPHFERHGLTTTVVGYPAIEEAVGGDGPSFRARHGLAAEAPVLCVMPGSRKGEIRRMLPTFRETTRLLAREVPGLEVVVPTVPNVADLVAGQTEGFGARVTLVADAEEKRHLYAASTAALVKSGTGAMECAAAGVPVVVGYRMSPLTYFVLRRVARIRYASVANLLEDRAIQPEFLQGDCRPDRLAAALLPLFSDTETRRREVEDGLAAARRVGLGGTPPSVLAARAVLSCFRSASAGPAPRPGS
jgi:lipid-A-disaccharide synthase